MSDPISEGVNTAETNDKTRNLYGQEMTAVSSADTITVPALRQRIKKK